MNIVVATGNTGKVKEIQASLLDLDIKLIPQIEMDIPTVEETESTFVGNAIIKARNAARHSGLPAMADDSGLVVDALNGSPGIYSSRFAGENSTDKQNIEKLLDELEKINAVNKAARFYCVIVLLRHAHDPSPIICEGCWEGKILPEPQGENGFGYDPIFYVPTYSCSAAQLTLTQKMSLSHRGQALNSLRIQLATSAP